MNRCFALPKPSDRRPANRVIWALIFELSLLSLRMSGSLGDSPKSMAILYYLTGELPFPYLKISDPLSHQCFFTRALNFWGNSCQPPDRGRPELAACLERVVVFSESQSRWRKSQTDRSWSKGVEGHGKLETC